MFNKQLRTSHLQQIPVFKLRDQVFRLLQNEGMSEELNERIENVLEHPVRKLENAIGRMAREKLVTLINDCPEIDNEIVEQTYFDYRYGSNPSLYIYLFKADAMGLREVHDLRRRLKKYIEEFNEQEGPRSRPRVRNLKLDRLFQLPEHPEVIEGNYTFHRRLDLVDVNRNPSSIYETVYGFFWINTEKGYAVIQARDRTVLQHLETAINVGADIHLANLFISKELKNALPYLLNESLYNIKLHDPNPKSRRVCWVTMTDDELYHKGYKNWEERYPVISSARYKIKVGDTLGRCLKIDFENGEMSFAGKLTATQLIEWSLVFLSGIVDTIRDFESKPGEFITTDRFSNVRELRKYDTVQRERITRLISQLLELKHDLKLGSRDIEMSPMEFARDMGNLARVQFQVKCQDESCSKSGYLTCPECDKSVFQLTNANGAWTLECANGRRVHWSANLPIVAKCESSHRLKITYRDLEQWIEILPSQELLMTISDIINDYLPGYSFYEQTEYFMIHKRNLIYYEDNGEVPNDEAGRIINISRISAGDIYGNPTIAGFKIIRKNEAKKAQAIGKKKIQKEQKKSPRKVASQKKKTKSRK